MKQTKIKLPKALKRPLTESWIDYKDSIVIFIDILGFKELIDNSYSRKKKIGDKKNIANIYDAIQTIRSVLGLDEQEYYPDSYFMMNFSDSIVITFPYDKPDALFETITRIQELVLSLNHVGVIVRGGIVKGLVYADKDHQMIFGPGLVEAYILESKAALYPRIILEPKIVKICQAYTRVIGRYDLNRHLKSILTLDGDGMYFIDYFKPLSGDYFYSDYALQLSKTKAIIEKGLLKRSPDIKIKYMWMRRRFNENLKSIQAKSMLKAIATRNKILALRLEKTERIK